MKRNLHTEKVFPGWKHLWLFATCLLSSTLGFSQQLLTGANMEDSAAWTVYNLNSTVPASYEFNYTTETPSTGHGGCLRVTASQRANILFWQKVTLKGGKSYVVDGAIKTGNAANFWAELYLSTVAPVEGVDYAPNNNGDVVLGFSTWAGCGPNVDGTFSDRACTGKRIYKVPGAYNADVDVYFALKTGSSASTFPAPLQVLIDNLSLTIIEDWKLLATEEGVIDTVNTKVKKVSPFITVEDFRGGLRVAPTARVDVVGITGETSIPNQDTTIIADSMAVRVAGINDTTLYPIELRRVGSNEYITWVYIGLVDPFFSQLILPSNARVIQLKSALVVAPHATFKVVDRNGVEVDNLATVNNRMKVVVTAENGDTRTYRVKTIGLPLPSRTITSYNDTIKNVFGKIVTIKGSSVITVTDEENPLKGSVLNLKSDDIWLYFPNIKPSVFYDKYLAHVMVNNQAAVMDENIRLEQYLQGTVLISHSSDYKPLEIFSSENLGGASMQLGVYTYHRAVELGVMHDSIKSFRLKKGYMATFAKDELGTGYSRVYIADNEDIVIDTLPKGLYNDVSFVRIIPWRWVAKKGWTSGRSSAEALNCSWQYDWDNAATSGLNVEYIPMRHNRWWNSFENINNKKKSTHALGFNEPERTDQANMSVNDAIALWPELLKSGLRLGSPAPSDGGLEWLYQFIDRCDAMNYRVDFVAMHWYMGGQTPQQFYNRLKAIHERTKRPIWITEWNNGANWTCCKPTYPQQAEAIADFLHMLDTTSFVERYSLYEWVQDTRQMFFKSPKLLTPAGFVYRDKVSPMAYNPAKAYSQDYVTPPVVPTEYAGAGVGFNHGKSLAADIDDDGDLDILYSGVDPYVGGILKNDGSGNFTSTGQSLRGIYIPSLNAGDPDGDGDLDIIFAGWDRANSWAPYARTLRNNGTGTFTEETPPSINAPVAGFADLDNNGLLDYFMIGNGNNNKFYFQQAGGFQSPVVRVSNGSNIQDPDATWADLDNDQDVDFCVEAYNRSASRRYTQVWKNNGHGVFTEQAIPFKQKHWGSAQFGDIDSDGDLDMLLNGDGDGHSDGGNSEIYRLYINNGSGNFTEGATFQNYRQNTNGKGSSFVDWDSDGDYDIILTGWSSSEGKEVANIYLNDGTGVFTKSEESVTLPGVNRGTIELGDFDSDGKIDLLLNGYSGRLYGRTVAFLIKNTTAQSNTAPLAPSGLLATAAGDSVQFSWSAGTDAETNVNALTYNLYVKDSTGKFYVFPNANIATGKRMTVGHGNACHNLGWRLRGLPAGTYTWSVQAIDASYTGSAFASESSFTIGVPDSTSTSAMRMAVKPTDTETVPEQTSAIYLYPNPAEDEITIYGGGTRTEVALYSSTGKLLRSLTITEESSVYVGDLPAGVYVVKGNDGKRVTISRFVKR